MAVALEIENPEPKRPLTAEERARRRRRSLIISVILGSIVVHAIALGLFGLWVVAEYFKEPEAIFTLSKNIRIPPPPPQHRMNMAKHEAMTPKPSFTDKLVSTRPVEFALPDLPKVDLDQMLPLDPSELISDQVSSLVGAAGFGRGLGSGLSGGAGSGEGLSFFGIRATGKRILLLFDVSRSVVNKAEKSGVPMSEIKKEAMELIDGLAIDSRFGLIQFVRNHKLFRTELVAASQGNKDLARQWVETQWSLSGSMPSSGRGVVNPRPNGIQSVLEAAFAMKPDVVFLISDGSFWRDPGNEKVPYRELGDTLGDLEAAVEGGSVPVHFVGFEMRDDERATLKRIFRRHDGDFREIAP
ncbi:MAG: hypothetical protein ACC661_03185 [Verrucomicrobiales bacterium]